MGVCISGSIRAPGSLGKRKVKLCILSIWAGHQYPEESFTWKMGIRNANELGY